MSLFICAIISNNLQIQTIYYACAFWHRRQKRRIPVKCLKEIIEPVIRTALLRDKELQERFSKERRENIKRFEELMRETKSQHVIPFWSGNCEKSNCLNNGHNLPENLCI
jgi:hypothetical protein